MTSNLRNVLLAALVVLLTACSGGGGGDSASGVEPGPPPPGGPVDPPPPEVPGTPSPYAEAEQLFATITSATLNDDNQAVVEFQLTDGRNIPITDLAVDNVRFVIAKLQGSEIGNLTGTWQSYVNQIETAGNVGPGTEDKLQATYERDGEFVNNNNGTYTYTFATSLTNLPQDILDQAATEELNLDFEAGRTHRVAIQFDGSISTANPFYDWVPSSGATGNVFNMQIASTTNCNACHDPLNFHGGNRREVEYCVTCHNAGSTDANSGNTIDMKVMIHKIHMGVNLPSVQDGGEYAFWGFRDRKHDYSGLRYPQDVRNCVNCHVGTGTAPEDTNLILTAQGDNWAEAPSRAACGSCHENVDWDRHRGGQPDDSRCSQCHAATSSIGAIQAHIIPVIEARKAFEAIIDSVDNTSPGDTPTVSFRVRNPQTGEDYDILSDPAFANDDARLAVGLSWNTADYTNFGNGGSNASQSQVDALANATANGDGGFSVTFPAIPNSPFTAGSGTATVEGHPSIPLDEDGDGEAEIVDVPVGDAHAFFSITEPDGQAVPRRYASDQADVLAQCHNCHSTLVLHGNNRADNLDSCVTCHNPRNTDRVVRELPGCEPPSDGKSEESIDFKTMIHGIHAAAVRENPLQIVGFRCFNTYVYDEEHVHYPGNLANCESCHVGDSFMLPLADTVLGTTVDSGFDPTVSTSHTVITPATAVCASCHDGTEARAHMEGFGGNFATTQAAIDSGEVVETCNTCHAEGRANDAWEAHQRNLLK